MAAGREEEHIEHIPIAGERLGDGLFSQFRRRRPGKGRRRQRRPRIGRRSSRPGLPTLLVLLVLGIAVALISASSVYLPRFMTTSLPQGLAARLGQPVTIGTAAFDPLTLTLTLGDGRIGMDSDGKAPLLSFATMRLDFSGLSFFRGLLLTERVEIEKPFLALLRKSDKTLPLQALLESLKKPPKRLGLFDWSALAESLFYSMAIHNLVVSDGTIAIDDQVRQQKHTVDGVKLTVPFLALGGDAEPEQAFLASSSQPVLSGRFDNNPFQIAGEPIVSTEGEKSWRLRVRADDIDLASQTSLLTRPGQTKLTGGKGSIDLTALVGTAAVPLRFEAAVRLMGVVLEDDGIKTALLPEVTLTIAGDEAGNGLVLGDLTLTHPEFTLTRTSAGTWLIPGLFQMLSEAMNPASEKHDEDTGKGTTLFSPIRLTGLTMAKARVLISDNTPAATLTGLWQDATVTIETAGPGQAAFSLEAMGTTGEELYFTGVSELTEPAPDGTLQVKNCDLRRLAFFLGDDTLPAMLGAMKVAFMSAHLTAGDQGKRWPPRLSDIEAEFFRFDIAAGDGQTLTIPRLTLSQAKIDGAARLVDLGVVSGEGAEMVMTGGPDELSRWYGLFSGPEAVGPGTFGWQIVSQSLSLSNSVLKLALTVDGRPWQQDFHNLSLHLAGLNNDPARITPVTVSAIVGSGEMRGDGTITFFPFSLGLRGTMRALPLKLFETHLAPWFPAGSVTGSVSLEGAMTLPRFALTGTAAIANFAATHNGSPALGWKQAEISDVTVTTDPLIVQIRNLSVTEPSAAVTIKEDGSIVVTGLQKQATKQTGKTDRPDGGGAAGAGDSVVAAAEEPSFTIENLRFDQGRLQIDDRRQHPPYQTRLEGLKGEIKEIDNDSAAPSPVRLSGADSRGAQLTFDGALGFFSDPPRNNWQLTVKDYPIAALDPYLQPLLGREVTAGTLAAAAQYREEDESIEAKVSFTARDLAFTGKENRENRLPLTLALVTGPRGIELSLPLSGVSVDPDFSIYGAITAHLKRLLLKSTVSPPAVLTMSGFPAGFTLPDHIPFDYGSATLTAAGTETLARMATVLSERPLLAVRLRGGADVVGDGSLLPGKKDERKNRLLALAGDRAKTAQQALLALKATAEQVLMARETDLADQAGPERTGNRVKLILEPRSSQP